MELIETELLGHGCRHFLAVAREHNGMFDAGGVQVADRLLGIGLNGVGNHDVAGVRAVDQHVQNRADDLAIGSVDTGRGKHLGVADDDVLAVDGCRYAMTRVVGGVAHALGVDLALVGGTYGLSDGVVGERLGKGRDLEERLLGIAGLGVHRDDREGAVGERAGLVEDDGVNVGKRLEVVGALDEHAQLGRAADAAKEAERHTDYQRARAADDEEGQAAQDPVGPSTGDQTAAEREHRCGAGDGGRVDACEARDEVLGARLLFAGVFHELQDAADGGLAKRFGGAHADKARHVDAAADDIVSGLGRTGDRLAGEGGGVELRLALDDDTVDGHALAGLDHDDSADGDVIGKDLLERAVGLLDVGVVGRDVHHGTDRFAALAHGVGLEQLADLVEQHDGGAFGHVRVGVGEEHHGKCADGCDCHEKALIEGLAAADVVERLLQHVVTGDQKRHEEQREACVDVARLAERCSQGVKLLESVYHRKDAQRDQDAIALMLEGLFLLALLLFLPGVGGCHDSYPPI